MRLLTALMLALGSVVFMQSPAVAASCSWTVTELAPPSGYSHATATAHAGTGLVVGTVWRTDHREGVVWRNRVPQVLPPPVSGGGSNYPRAVNGAGVIAGYWVGNNGFSTGWRYTNGTYQFLASQGTRLSIPLAINGAGDVAGYSFAGISANAILWRIDRPTEYTYLGAGYAIGVDSSRRVVLSTGIIVNGDGSTVLVQGGGVPSVFQDGRIMGYRGTSVPYTIVEWNLAGQVVRQIPGGVPRGVNTAGAIVGRHDNGMKAVWRNGAVEYVTSPAPAASYVHDITEDNVIVSDYSSGGTTRSGLWRCL
jgi:hypothetical protein